MKNIYPIHENQLTREDKELKLKQRGTVIWLTGLSGAGKSTLSVALEKELFALGYHTQLLDGDNIRIGLCNNLSFSVEDRLECTRRVAEVAKLFINSGIITICSFVSQTNAMRKLVKNIVGEESFYEIYINAPLRVAEKRDVKGLYKKARSGEIKDFTGLHSEFEAPENPALELRTDALTVQESVELLLDFIYPKIRI